MILLDRDHYQRRIDYWRGRGRRDREAEGLLETLDYTGHAAVALLSVAEADELRPRSVNQANRRTQPRGTDDDQEESEDHHSG